MFHCCSIFFIPNMEYILKSILKYISWVKIYKFTNSKRRRLRETCWENVSSVLCPFFNIAAARKMAFATFNGNNSIAYDIHAPPKS